MPLERPEEALLDAPAIARRVYGTRMPQEKRGDPDAPPVITPDGEPARKLTLTPIDMQVLIALSEDPDELVGKIAERLALKSSTVTHAIRDLWEHGLIEENRVTGHGRRRSRPLTAEGRRRAKALIAHAQAVLDEHAKPQG